MIPQTKTITFKLSEKIEFDGKVYDEITIRSPKMKDLKVIQNQKDDLIDGNAQLISRLSGVPVLALEELEGSDWVALCEEVDSFLTKKPKKIQPK